MLFGKIARDGKQIRLQITDRGYVFQSEHSQVDLLREIGRVRALADAPVEESLQRPPVRCKQSLHQRILSVRHATSPQPRRCAFISTRVARPALGRSILDLPRQQRTGGRNVAAAVAGATSAKTRGAGAIQKKDGSHRWRGLFPYTDSSH